MTDTLRFAPALAAAPILLVAVAAEAGLVADAAAPQFAGRSTVDISTGDFGLAVVTEPTVVYSNLVDTAGDTLRAFTSTDLDATFGDALTLTDTGRLDELSFTIFNSTGGGANTSPLTGFTATFDVFDDADDTADPSTDTPVGSFSATFGPLGTPLTPGQFGIFTVTGIADAEIDIPDDNVVITQTLSNITGGTTRLGVVSVNPIDIGSAIDPLYIDAEGVGTGPGFFNITSGGAASPFFLGLEATLVPIPEPGTAGLIAVAGVGLLARRRR